MFESRAGLFSRIKAGNWQEISLGASDGVLLDLFVRTAACGIADGPSCLLLDVKLSMGQQLYQGRDDLCIYDCLHPHIHLSHLPATSFSLREVCAYAYF